MMTQPALKTRATVGLLLAVAGFVAALTATHLRAHTPMTLAGALMAFTLGLVMVETALFRALDLSCDERAAGARTAGVGDAWS